MDDDEDVDPHFYQIQFKLTCPYQSFVQILNQMYVDFWFSKEFYVKFLQILYQCNLLCNVRINQIHCHRPKRTFNLKVKINTISIK